jgi:hypothetical protein
MDMKHVSAAGLWTQSIGEATLGPGALMPERQGVDGRDQMIREPFAIFLARDLDTGQRGAGLFGFDDPDSGATDKEEIIRKAMPCFERELADGDAAGNTQVRMLRILHRPSCLREHGVNDGTCVRFRTLHRLILPNG